MPKLKFSLLLLSVLSAMSVLGLGQTSNGTIAGTVVDASGAGVAKAAVTIAGLHSGVERKTTTNAVGGFRLESVLLDTYTVTVEAPGFSKRRVTNMVVNASVITSVNPVLMPGSVTETVQVEAASELIQTDSGELSATLGTQAVENLPIATLNPYALAITLPGVSEPPVEYQNAAGFPNGFSFSVNGSRPRADNFLIEGQDNNDQGVHGQALEPKNLEAYKDVTFLLNSYSAEFGHGGGSVSNLILKSGTNSIHGAVWDRLENSSLDALDKGDLLNGSTTKSLYRENIAGFSVGGPVLKNRLFLFAAYQFDHYRATANLNPIIVPTAAGVATLQALPNNPRVANYLQAIGSLRGQSGATFTSDIPLGADPVTGLDRGSVEVGPYRRNLNNSTDASELDIKSDYVISPSDTLQLHYIYSPSGTPYNLSAAMLPGFDTEIDSVAHNAGLVETHTFTPRLLNEFRFSYGRIGFSFGLRPETIANPLATLPTTSIGINAGIIPGTVGEVTGFGAPSGFPQGRFHNTYQIQDAVSWNKGKHTIKAGFDLPIVQVRDEVPFNLYGSLGYAADFSFSGLANYIDDFGGEGGAVVQNFGNPTARLNFYFQNYFVEDNWTVSPNLTVQLGLRYEYAGAPFNNIKFVGVTPATANDFTAAVPQQADKGDWGPRFGFAYTPNFLGAKKTVVRGGFGIFYDGQFTAIDDNLLADAPSAATPEIVSTTGDNPRGIAGFSTLFPTLNRTAGPMDLAAYIAPHLLAPRTLQWNLNIERELPGSFTAQVGYVGSRGEHLYATTEFNPLLNGYVSADRVFNGRGRIEREDNTGDSIYHALQAQVVRKYRNGLQFRAAYTFSRAEDDVSEVFTAAQFSQFGSEQYPASRKTTDYGLSAFDHRQRLVFSYVYALPKWSNAPRAMAEVVNGWQISGVSQFQSGNPGNVEIGADWNGDGIANDRPQLGNPKAPLASFAFHGDDNNLGFFGGPGTYCSGAYVVYTADPCHPVDASSVHWIVPYLGDPALNTVKPIGRNSVILRGFEQWDFSAQKSFRTWREQSFDFRAEMFDVFNHGNTGTPNLDLSNGFADPTNSSTVTSFGNYAPTVTGHRSIRMYLRYSF